MTLFALRSGFGHDKSQAILPYRDLDNPPTLLFFGDGVSGNGGPDLLTTIAFWQLYHYRDPDISAAKHADVLFVKKTSHGDNDLSVYCERENIKHIMFDTFSAALPIVQEIVSGNKSIQDFCWEGFLLSRDWVLQCYPSSNSMVIARWTAFGALTYFKNHRRE